MHSMDTEQDGQEIVRVAIIGTGLAGLNAAHLLSHTATLRQRYEVHLFEKGDQLGLDASSIVVDGRRIDVPMRSFNAGYYPELMKLYRSIGIPIVKKNYSFSFATDARPRSPFLLYNGRSGLRGVSLPRRTLPRQVSASKSSSAAEAVPSLAALTSSYLQYMQLISTLAFSYVCLLVLALYHYIPGHLHDPQHALSATTLQDWLSRHTRLLRPQFVDSALLPLFSAMTTSSFEQVMQIPAAEVLLYVAATFLRNHYSVCGGVSQVQSRLTRHLPADRFHLSTAIERVQGQTQDKKPRASIVLQARQGPSGEMVRFPHFDHVIFATPANLSSNLLGSYAAGLERESSSADAEPYRAHVDRIRCVQSCLEQVRYTSSTVVNHRDPTFCPSSRRDWRDLNIVSPSNEHSSAVTKLGKAEQPTSDRAAMATHVCHRLNDGTFVFQTTNPASLPRSSTILGKATFARALTTSKRRLAGLFSWERSGSGLAGGWKMGLGPLQKRQGDSGVTMPGLWVCGSYAQGIPLLEGCVTSSTLVVNALRDQDDSQRCS